MFKNNKTHVLVGMSGGVDSSLAALLLLEKGYKVSGVTMKIWGGEHFPNSNSRNACYGPGEEEDIIAAEKNCDFLGIPFHVIDLANEFRKNVLDYFQDEYVAGRTPNPCVVCNKKIKFHFLLERSRETGISFDYFATGHYARIEYDKTNARYLLLKAADKRKDQSYFLFALSQAQLKQTIFPLGDKTKQEVREIAKAKSLPAADKSESQDFVSTNDYSILFKTKSEPGAIIDKEGNILGQHRGIVHYTIGQRRGLGLAMGIPVYVTAIDRGKNTITIGNENDLKSKQFTVNNLNWIAIEKLVTPITVQTKIRQNHKAQFALVEPLTDKQVLVTFENEQSAITPGQMAVFYQKDKVIGGGVIEN